MSSVTGSLLCLTEYYDIQFVCSAVPTSITLGDHCRSNIIEHTEHYLFCYYLLYYIIIFIAIGMLFVHTGKNLLVVKYAQLHCTYTMNHKKRDILFLTITLANEGTEMLHVTPLRRTLASSP